MKVPAKEIEFFNKPIQIGNSINDENAKLWQIGTDKYNTKYVCFTDKNRTEFPKQDSEGYYPTLEEFIKFDPDWELF